MMRTMRHYCNLSRTLPRMRHLIVILKHQNTSFVTVREVIEDALPSELKFIYEMTS